jgi:F-type H+-transporting ATPase subunit b
MEILRMLGVDGTLWIHLACFLVSYVTFSKLILKPYMAALNEREKRTVGNEEHALRLVEEANQLGSEYEQKARAINSQIKGAYDESRTAAMREYDRLVQSAREESQKLLESARADIGREVQSARKTLSGEVPAVAAAMASKLAGKDISL